MPSVSKKQQRFMGAELSRKRAGKKTQTGMSEKQLEDYASTKTKGLPNKKKESNSMPKKKNPQDHAKENMMEKQKMAGGMHMMPGKMPMKDSEMKGMMAGKKAKKKSKKSK